VYSRELLSLEESKFLECSDGECESQRVNSSTSVTYTQGWTSSKAEQNDTEAGYLKD
jgi:hypothetical protein